jgi:hypothetical protein
MDKKEEDRRERKKKMSSVPMDYSNEKLRILMKELELHKLTTEQAEVMIQLLEEEKQKSIEYANKDYEATLSELLDLLKRYVAGEINLYQSEINVKISNV